MSLFHLGKIHLIVFSILFGILSLDFAASDQFDNDKFFYKSYSHKDSSLLLIEKLILTNGDISHKIRFEQGSQPAKRFPSSLFSHLPVEIDFSESEIEVEEDCDGHIDLRLNKNEASLIKISNNSSINQKYDLKLNHFISTVWRPPQA